MVKRIIYGIPKTSSFLNSTNLTPNSSIFITILSPSPFNNSSLLDKNGLILSIIRNNECDEKYSLFLIEHYCVSSITNVWYETRPLLLKSPSSVLMWQRPLVKKLTGNARTVEKAYGSSSFQWNYVQTTTGNGGRVCTETSGRGAAVALMAGSLRCKKEKGQLIRFR